VSVLGADAAAVALRLGDDALICSQRLCEWSAKSPAIEEDIALANIALDLLGQARVLLTYAGTADGTGRSEDDLAFLRNERDWVNCLLVEQPNGDFAATMARQLFFSAYQLVTYRHLLGSPDAMLAAVAGKAVKEVAYHLDHASGWVVRLGDGTDESHRRMQAGLDAMWPYTFELFEDDRALQPEWEALVLPVIAEATLAVPSTTWQPSGGRSGRHSEHFGFLLAEMQHLHRSHPGATW
jgi:ring-1,2-phenylacetyl-CoA epoxidase subunit PaaC